MKKWRTLCKLLTLGLLLPAFSACATQVKPLPSDDTTGSPLGMETVEGTLADAPIFLQPENTDISFLTAQEFHSCRTAGEVSDAFRKVTADFSLDLLQGSRAYAEGNGLLVSPLSALLALAMTANGAEGETLSQMEEVLAGGMSIETLNAELYNYTSSLVSTEDVRFNLANAIWMTSSPSFTVHPDFIGTVENTYDADIVTAQLDEAATVDAINAWVKKQTHDMIEKLYDAPLDPNTVMLLLNALAFDGVWEEQSADDACAEGVFYGTDDSVQKTTFMWADCDAYLSGEDEVGIVKHYKGDHYAFLALLPIENIDIYEYLSALDGETFLSLYDTREAAAEFVDISAHIPFFTFDCTIKLNDTLAALGMPRAFDKDYAEFGALGSSTVGNIYIDRVLQKTYIELDNKGTKAAAVTVAEEKVKCESKDYKVVLDRPFVYAIIDTQTGLPIFIGACENIGT